MRLSSRRSRLFFERSSWHIIAFDVAEWNPYGLIAEVHDTFLVVDRFVQRIGRFIRKEIRLRLGPTKRLITDVCGWTFLKISDIVVFRYIAGTVILALETGISDVVFLKIRSVVRELHQYVWTIVPCSCCPQLLFREVVYLVKVFYGAPVRILVSAGELVGPADNCADRFAGVG